MGKKSDLNTALDILVKYKVFIRFNEQKVYHGRVGNNTEWRVDPKFNNSGNASGNMNVNQVPALSAADKKIAKQFADFRFMQQANPSLSPEVHRIISEDNQAVVLNDYFNLTSLNPKAQNEVLNALSTLVNFSITKFAPIKFENRETFKAISDVILSIISQNDTIICDDLIPEIEKRLQNNNINYNLDELNEIIGAFNTKILLSIAPDVVIKKFVTVSEKTPKIKTSAGDCLISHEYLSAWLSHNHIIGLFYPVYSASLDEKIDIYSIFDLHKINTLEAIAEKHQAISSKFGEITKLINKIQKNTKLNDFLLNSTAEEILDKLQKSNKFGEMFKNDAGVWEKFSVGEHTESVLRVFEDSFESSLPPDLTPFVKLAIISHDIGKGLKNSLPNSSQKLLNKKVARDFYEHLKLKPELQQLLLFVISDSQALTTDHFVNNNPNALQALTEKCEKTLYFTLKRKPTEAEVSGLAEVCKILQTCDSASYSRYGITRDKTLKFYYKNGSDLFTSSFEPPQGLGKRCINFKTKIGEK